MISVTKKQASLALVVVAFATIMIAGSIASSTGSAFANRERHNFEHFSHFDQFNHFNHSNHHGKSSHTDQSINEQCNQPSHSAVLTAGAVSPVLASGNNVDVCANLNFAGNAAGHDQSHN
jgi:hypothetical protein